MDFDDFIDTVLTCTLQGGSDKRKISAETDFVISLSSNCEDRCQTGEQFSAWSERFECGADALGIFIKYRIGEDAGDILDGAGRKGMIEKAMHRIPKG